MNFEIVCVCDNGESLVYFLWFVINFEYIFVYNLV